MHSKQTPSLLDFPIVPLEAIVLSVDALSTRARLCLLDENGFVPQANLSVNALPGVNLTAISASPPGSPALGDKYFNTTDHMIHTAVQNGGSISWDAGSAPVETAIYALPGNTLYIKSVISGVTFLSPVGSQLQPQQLAWLPSVTGCRTPNTAYDVGDKAAYPGQPEWYLLATAAGTTGDQLPLWPSDPVSGATVIYDGTVTWQLNQIPGSNSQATFEANGTVRVWSNLSQHIPEDDHVYVPTVEAMREYIHDYLRDHLEDLVVVQCNCSGGGSSSANPMELYLAPVITPSIPNTTPTAQNIVLTAEFDPAVTQKKYSTDGQETWLDYPVGGATVTANNKTVHFQGFDDIGNWTAVASYTVTNIDRQAPGMTYTWSPALTQWTNGNVTLSMTMTGEPYEADYKLWDLDEPDMDLWGDDYTALTLSGTGSTKTATINITDNCNPVIHIADEAGNIAVFVPGTVTRIDRTAPTITGSAILAPGGTTPAANTWYTSKTARVSASKPADTAPIAEYWFKMNGTAADTTGWTKSATSAASCSYNCTATGTCYVRVYDAAGNYAATSMAIDYVNNTAPVSPTITPSTTAATNQDVTLTAVSDASAVYIYYKRPSDTNYSSSAGSSAVVTASSNGTYWFYAVNNANTKSTSKSYAVNNIDKTGPTINLTDYDTEHTLAESYITATVAAPDTGATIYWRWKEAGSNTWSNWTQYTTQLLIGDNGTYEFKAADALGNESTTSLTFNNLVTDTPRT